MKRRTFVGAALLAPVTLNHAQTFPVVAPGRRLAFPRDHGAHPEYRTEWWYVTGWVNDGDGRELGIQVTFFRSRPAVAEGNPSAFAPKQLVFAHAAVAEASHGRLRHDQRAARAAFDLAGADDTTTRAWLRDWSLALQGDTYRAVIAARDFAFDLRFRSTQPVLLQGDNGYSRKGERPEEASWYYSRPQLDIRGTLEIEGRTREVSGRAWLDHEWSSAYLAAGAVGWDWVGINLHDGGALMAFAMRARTGGAVWAGGTLRDAQGTVKRFGPGDIRYVSLRTWTSPRTGISYPVALDLNAGGTSYRIAPMMDDQELDSRATTGTLYWEGAVRLLREESEVGRGYLELTGYGGALDI